MPILTASDPLPDDVPPDIDITLDKYRFGKVEWDVPPFINCITANQREKQDRREGQDEIYRSVGNPITWDQYLSIGYYIYDDCFQFETQWTKMGSNLLAKYKFIWFSYQYHSNRYLMTADELEAWAMDIARPYLIKHAPDYTPDTSDPRNGRFDETDDDIMEIDDERKQSATATEAGWTLMGANGRPVKNPPSPELSPVIPPALVPLPESPTPVTTQPTPLLNTMLPPTPVHPPARMLPTPRGDTHVSHNDGTLRLTIRWNPQEYTTLKPSTSTPWITAATDILHYLLITAPDCQYHTWDPTITQQTLPILSLTPGNLLDFISPRIAEIDSKETFVFGIRVSMCSGGSPGPWINNQATQAALFKHRMEVSISNATSDSGDITIAGYILLKDPSITHRVHFISSIRKALPNLPFFDLGVHRRSPHGSEVPHLVVRCGEKLVDQLTTNLSTFMNGIDTTSLFISRVHMMNITPNEVNDLFDIHSNFLTQLNRISLSPHIIHIDRIRTENATPDRPAIDRSTRQWAASLRAEDGTHLQGDVECGSRDRQVYLLVPSKHTHTATAELKKYMASLQNLRPSTVLNYTPSALVITNVDFLKSLSANVNPWNTVPPPPTPILPRPSNPATSTTYNPPSKRNPPQDDTSIGTAQSQHTNQTTYSKFNYARRMLTGDDQTMATTQPSISATANAKFDEMEAEILRHQAEFKSVHSRFDKVEDQALRTMSVCQASSRSLLELRTESQQQLKDLKLDSAKSMKLLRDESKANQKHLQDQLTRLFFTLEGLAQDLQKKSTPSSSSASNSTTSSAHHSHLQDATSSSSMSTTRTSSPVNIQVTPPSPSISHFPRNHTSLEAASQLIARHSQIDQKKRSAQESHSTDQVSAQNKSPRAPDGCHK